MAPDHQEIVVAGDQVVSASGGRAPEEIVVVSVATHPGGGLVREHNPFGPEEAEKDLTIARADRVLLGDLGPAQHLGHLLDLVRSQE